MNLLTTKYEYDARPNTKIAEESTSIVEQLANAEYAVLVGRNNCGKSWLLKTLTQKWGQRASYLGPARYQNFNLLTYYTPNKSKRSQRKYQEFINMWNRSHENLDNSPLNLQQSIAELSDSMRDRLSEIMKLLLGVEIDICHTVADNSMSQKYVSCGGHNISFTSSGFRLITALVTSLLDNEFDTFLIDEPELGISPEAQAVLSDFLFDRESRTKYFPHIKSLILATHSTVFLDRRNIENNYQVQKLGDEVSLSQVKSMAEFNRIHFFLLGNRFETLYLPTGIVIVEGKTDFKFIERVLAFRYPDSQISVLQANGDGRIKEILHIAKGLLTDIQKSPYRERIFVVLDSVHTASITQQIETIGIPKENIIRWSKNGIEYVYPPSILNEIFGQGSDIAMEADLISRNGVSYNKNDLAAKVVEKYSAKTDPHPEFKLKFLDVLERALQLPILP